MVVVVGEGGDDSGAQFVRLAMAPFQRRPLLQMVVHQPGMVNQTLQDQRLPARDRAALAAHQGARRKLRACRLIGSGAERGKRIYPLVSRALGAEPAGRSAATGLKT